VAGAWDNFQSFRPAQPGESLLIKFDDDIINSAYDQKRRRVNLIEDIAGKIRASAARDNRSNSVAEPRCRNECRRRSRARAEETKAKIPCERLVADPVNGIDNAPGQKRYIEDIGPVRLLFRSQKIEQERRHSLRVQSVGNRHVARAQPA
jgi:hypothetical protein